MMPSCAARIGRKIDWGSLSSAQREAALGELDSARLIIRE
jgi:hypothetical protein